jgi:hypothetical protein
VVASNLAAELRSISVDPHRKRKEAERLTDHEEVSGEAPETRMTKRRRHAAGVASSGDNHNEEVDTRDAVIADLRAKLREKDREIASLKEHEKISRFLIDQWLPDDSDMRAEMWDPDYSELREKAEEMIRMMANAEPPQEIRDMSGRRYWNVWPPQITGAQISKNMPKTVCEMALKLYTQMLDRKLLDAMLLCSELISSLPSSEFHEITTVYSTIYDLAREERAMGLDLLFCLRELGHLVREKFGSPSDPPMTYLRRCLPSSDIVDSFCRFVSKSRTEDSSQLPGMLAKMCFDKRGSPSPPAFYREEIPNRGWLSSQKEDRFLLIDFNTHRVRIVERCQCSLERSNTDPSKAQFRIRGMWEGEEEMVLTLPMELGYWLGEWAKIKVDALTPVLDRAEGQGSRPSH